MDTYRNKIIGFYRDNRRMPSYTEIMKMLGLKSKNAVFKIIQKLVTEGALSKDSQGRLVPERLFGEVPMIGLVEAGFPTPAEEEYLDTMSLDELLIQDREASYILTVKGESMIDAGIHDGDLVIAERKGEPRDGDIVIAEVDGGWTMKYYRKRNGKVYLEPANKRFSNIYPEVELKVAAIVKAVIRKYK